MTRSRGLRTNRIAPGKRYGRLVAVAPLPVVNGRRKWELKCDCGKTHYSQVGQLYSGDCKSCGCLRLEVLRQKIKVAQDRAAEIRRIARAEKAKAQKPAPARSKRSQNGLGQSRAHLHPAAYVEVMAVKRSALTADLPMKPFKPLSDLGRWNRFMTLAEKTR